MGAKRMPLDAEVEAAIRAALEAALLSCEPTLQRAIKWRRPTFTVKGDWHHWLCAIQSSGGAVHLWFHKGGLLDDDARVLQPGGSSRYLRRLTYHAPQEVDVAVICPLIADAVRHQRDMLEASGR